MARNHTRPTHVNYLGLAGRFPVCGLQHDALEAEDVLDEAHELDKVLLAPAAPRALAVVLEEVPYCGVPAREKVALVQQRKSRLLHSVRQGGPAGAVARERLV